MPSLSAFLKTTPETAGILYLFFVWRYAKSALAARPCLCMSTPLSQRGRKLHAKSQPQARPARVRPRRRAFPAHREGEGAL